VTGSKIAIIGAGSIGVSWAIVFARAGHAVAIQDPDGGRLKAAAAELDHRLTTLAEAGLIDEAPAAVAGRVQMHGALADAVAGAVHIQECAPERLELKAQLLAEIDALAIPDAVIASSSSAIAIGESARDLPGRARCLVVHPANPPHLLPIVELVPAPFTDPEVVERAATLLRQAGMSPVHVRQEVEGFVYNRLQGAVLREAYCLVRDGVISVEELDRVMREGLGRRWAVIGPFETVDLNTRGGIAAHASKMGPAYARMGAERGQDDPWDDDLVSAVAAQRRALLPLSEWERRVEWRDAELIRQEQGRRAGRTAEAPENTGVPHSARPGQ
jgi:3-hydroxyacyl-CoA dehydrogenase